MLKRIGILIFIVIIIAIVPYCTGLLVENLIHFSVLAPKPLDSWIEGIIFISLSVLTFGLGYLLYNYIWYGSMFGKIKEKY